MEIWKTIAGWSGYEVSNLGRVRSLPRTARLGRRWKGKVLSVKGSKYPMVQLSNGVTERRYVHLLVLEAFRGPCPPGLEGCHNDGDNFNCRLQNLRWDTRKANAKDRTRHGTEIRGEQMHNAKLTETAVRHIRATKARTHGLAAKYGVTAKAVHAARIGKTWAHIQ